MDARAIVSVWPSVGSVTLFKAALSAVVSYLWFSDERKPWTFSLWHHFQPSLQIVSTYLLIWYTRKDAQTASQVVKNDHSAAVGSTYPRRVLLPSQVSKEPSEDFANECNPCRFLGRLILR